MSLGLEDRIKILERETESLDRQMAWMVWTRLAWLAMVIAGGIYLVATYPG